MLVSMLEPVFSVFCFALGSFLFLVTLVLRFAPVPMLSLLSFLQLLFCPFFTVRAWSDRVPGFEVGRADAWRCWCLFESFCTLASCTVSEPFLDTYLFETVGTVLDPFLGSLTELSPTLLLTLFTL